MHNLNNWRMPICQLSCSHNIAVKSLNSTRQDEVRIINGCKNIHEKIEVKRLVTFFAGCCARMVWHHQKFLFHACVMGKLVIWKKIHKKGVSFKDMMSVQGIFEGEFTLLIKRERGKMFANKKLLAHEIDTRCIVRNEQASLYFAITCYTELKIVWWTLLQTDFLHWNQF